MPAIVRVLWGEERPGCRWEKVWNNDVLNRLRLAEPVEQVVYVYGRNNADRLRELGQSVVLVNDDPFPDGKADYEEGGLNIRPWHYKIELLLAAIRDHGRVVYCDWDVGVQCKRKEDPFDLLEDFPFAFSAYSYARRRRFAIPRSGRGKRVNVTGCCMYMKGDEFLREILDYMRSRSVWHDEYALNDLIDSRHGGWPGERTWLREYENPCFVLGGGRSPWRLLTDRNGVVTRRTPVPFTWYRMFG